MIDEKMYSILIYNNHHNHNNHNNHQNISHDCGIINSTSTSTLTSTYILEIPYQSIVVCDLFLDYFSYFITPFIFIQIVYILMKYIYQTHCNYNYENVLFEKILRWNVYFYIFFYIYSFILCIILYIS